VPFQFAFSAGAVSVQTSRDGSSVTPYLQRAANTVELVSRASVGGKQEAPSATGQDAPPPSSATNASAPTAGGAEPQFPAPETRGCGRDAKSPDFVANWTFVVLTFFSMSLYLGSVNLQVEAVDPGSSDTKGFVSAFSWIAPLGALFAPAIGVVIDKLGFAAAFWIVIALGAVHNACAAVPWLPLQVVTFLTYTLSQVSSAFRGSNSPGVGLFEFSALSLPCLWKVGGMEFLTHGVCGCRVGVVCSAGGHVCLHVRIHWLQVWL